MDSERTSPKSTATDGQRAELISQKPSTVGKFTRILFRITMIIIITYAFGWVLNRSVQTSEKSKNAAGFGRGVLHGALMPGAMPSLFFGKDVVIYAANNNGRLYKLGYTFGVNACGLLFFGVFYYRVNRWRKNYVTNG
ncbi:MAG: hypothetical protein ACO1QB_13720 [Verrucomicrobiales bacterium]